MALSSRPLRSLRPLRSRLSSHHPSPPHHPSIRRFTEATSHPLSRVQVFLSRSPDPFLNLSIEHLLLQKSHPDSTVLFLYTNRPSVVIGRNQNPWLEVNLGLLRRGLPSPGYDNDAAADQAEVTLVRRRSGGGAVFHDAGNTNYSVICPPASFDRDKHAEMVVRALASLGVPGVSVNCRHDIVIAGGEDATGGGRSSTADAAPQKCNAQTPQTYKVSGSAYKLTRLRSLHHGTCLLSSPNLARLGPLLRSPAEPYIRARGVESVRSPVRNVGVGRAEFEAAVVREFNSMYGDADVECEVGEEALDVPEVRAGYDELKSLEWIFAQTPQFTFCTHPSESDPRERPPLPPDVPSDFRAAFTVRHGLIQQASVSGTPSPVSSESLLDRYLHQITDWRDAFKANESIGRWLNHLFGNTTR